MTKTPVLRWLAHLAPGDKPVLATSDAPGSSAVPQHLSEAQGATRRLSPIVSVLIAVGVVLLPGRWAEAQGHHGRSTIRGSAQPGVFDYYLMSLSWSPTYCVSHPEDRAQCTRKGYGFVLHGLWPQYTRGGYPQTCQTRKSLTP